MERFFNTRAYIVESQTGRKLYGWVTGWKHPFLSVEMPTRDVDPKVSYSIQLSSPKNATKFDALVKQLNPKKAFFEVVSEIRIGPPISPMRVLSPIQYGKIVCPNVGEHLVELIDLGTNGLGILSLYEYEPHHKYTIVIDSPHGEIRAECESVYCAMDELTRQFRSGFKIRTSDRIGAGRWNQLLYDGEKAAKIAS